MNFFRYTLCVKDLGEILIVIHNMGLLKMFRKRIKDKINIKFTGATSLFTIKITTFAKILKTISLQKVFY